MLLLLVQPWASGATATLTVAEASAPSEGGAVAFPVSLLCPPGQRVAALQFDIEFDPSALKMPAKDGVLAGTAAKAAGKQVNYSTVSPGTVRVLIVGFNQETVASGEVATFAFSVAHERPRALEPVHIRNAVLSDPNGNTVPVQGQDGGVRSAAAAVAAPSAASSAASDCRNLGPVVVCIILVICMLVGGTAAGVVWHRRARGKLRSQSARGKQRRRRAV
jgi:hypothetical protein